MTNMKKGVMGENTCTQVGRAVACWPPKSHNSTTTGVVYLVQKNSDRLGWQWVQQVRSAVPFRTVSR